MTQGLYHNSDYWNALLMQTPIHHLSYFNNDKQFANLVKHLVHDLLFTYRKYKLSPISPVAF